MERIFKRKLYDRLLEWKRVQNGKTAILIEGARRVGKSTLVELFAKKDETHNYEIDFLLSRGNGLHPIEVKSSGYKTHKSLDVFCEKFSNRVGERYLIYTKDYRQDGATTLLPVMMTMFL